MIVTERPLPTMPSRGDGGNSVPLTNASWKISENSYRLSSIILTVIVVLDSPARIVATA